MSLISLPVLANWQPSCEDSEQRLILTGKTWEPEVLYEINKGAT